MENSSSGKSRRIYGGLTQETRKAQRRKQFLQAGFEVFGTTGFRAATVRALCKEAKLTDRYFYESFGSIEKLLMAVYEQCMTRLTKNILHAMSTHFAAGGVSQSVEAGLGTYFSELEDPRIARICMVELEGISPEVDRLYNSYIRNFSTILIELAKKAYPDWNLNGEIRDVVGISLIGAMRQSATNWLMTDYATDRQSVVAGTKLLFMGTIELINSRHN